jgi:hypothetical protein
MRVRSSVDLDRLQPVRSSVAPVVVVETIPWTVRRKGDLTHTRFGKRRDCVGPVALYPFEPTIVLRPIKVGNVASRRGSVAAFEYRDSCF